MRRHREAGNADALTLPTEGAVVVGCDATPENIAALRYAAAEAVRRTTHLFVLITFSEPIDPDVDTDFDVPQVVRRERARERASRAFAAAVPTPPPHQVVAVAGRPSDVLLAMFPDVALIVIGGPHPRHLAWLTAGESTEWLLSKKAHVPVVIVPE